LRQICDKEGRYIIIDLEVGELICNIYAPNRDDPIFFQNVREQMIMFRCEEIILEEILILLWMSRRTKGAGKQ